MSDDERVRSAIHDELMSGGDVARVLSLSGCNKAEAQRLLDRVMADFVTELKLGLRTRAANKLEAVERVTGIGGFFFRARDPEALAIWYEERLGVTTVPRTYEEEPWRQKEGVTVFAPFPQDAEMIGPPEHTWMINFRVSDLDPIVEQLRSAGETVEVDPERYPNGRFAEVRDPEGNRIQLWQPMDPA